MKLAGTLWLLIALGGPMLLAQNSAQLQLANATVSQIEDGAGLGAEKMVAGETIFFRASVAGFKVGEGGKVLLTGHVQVFDPRGTAIAVKDEVVIGTSLRDEDKDWKPRLHSQAQIPSIAPPGVYRIRFDVTDEQTHANASGETSFSVDGVDVPASPTLAVRRFGFYRTQEDEAAMPNPAYRPGDTVWVRFDITGYKYGEQNAMDVAYDVAVSNAAGKQLFAQENAAVEKNQASYPQPWVPGSFSLTLQPVTSPGMYTVTITARDDVGKQTVAEKGTFRVE